MQEHKVSGPVHFPAWALMGFLTYALPSDLGGHIETYSLRCRSATHADPRLSYTLTVLWRWCLL